MSETAQDSTIGTSGEANQESGQELFRRHRDTLHGALDAMAARSFWTPYPESPSPKVYGEGAAENGKTAFEEQLGKEFPLQQPGSQGTAGTERSPYGFPLGVRYPRTSVETLVHTARAALPGWRDAGVEARTGVCLEALARLNARSFEMAHAVMHTSGQAFVMAFQAGGAQAQDRGLEAVAAGYSAMTAHPSRTRWEKPVRKGEPLRMDNSFTVVPRGVALMVGCNTFPTWNGYPGLFASLVTGNPVIVKPHPGAVLPLAITVAVLRDVLAAAGMDPGVVTLAAEDDGEGIAADLATHPDIRLVDFTGSTSFGEWLESNASQAVVHTEKAGVNTVLVDSCSDYEGMLANLAFSLSLYSGQMCTTPQNFLVPTGGIETENGHRSLAEFGSDLAAAIDRLTADPAKATGFLGAVANSGVLQRLSEAETLGSVVRNSEAVSHPEFPDATVRTPLVLQVEPGESAVYGTECFGPVSFIVPTADTTESLRIFRETVGARGALTAAVYSSSEDVLAEAERAALDCGVNLSENLTGGVYVNQTAAYADYHGSGANPAASAALVDPGYIGGRFHIVQHRRPAPAPA